MQTTPGDKDGREDIIAVSLRHNETGGRSKPTIHQLCTDVPIQDVRPPPGLECETLESVRLTLDFSYIDSHKRRKIYHRVSSTGDNLNDYFATKISTAIQESELLDMGSESVVHEPPERDRCAPNTDLDEWFLQESDDESLLEELRMDGNVLDSSSITALNCNLPPSCHRRPSSPSEVLAQHDHGLVLEDVMELLDAATRYCISNTPQRLSQGIKITRRESFTHFSDFAPSLWLPGYLPAVSQRAAFLPSLSHALINIGGKHSRSISLRHKLDELARQNRISGHAGHGDTGPEDNISTSLWRLLQQGCHKSTSAALPIAFHVGKDEPVRCGGGGVHLFGSSQGLLSEMDVQPGKPDEDEDFYSIESNDPDEQDLFDAFYLGDLPLSAVRPVDVPLLGISDDDCIVCEEEQLEHLIEDPLWMEYPLCL